MAKTRVYELARQINVNSKEIIKKLNEYGRSVNNHMSSLEDAEVKRLTTDLKPRAAQRAEQTHMQEKKSEHQAESPKTMREETPQRHEGQQQRAESPKTVREETPQRHEGQSADSQRREQRQDNQRADGQRRDGQRQEGQRQDNQRAEGQRRDGQRQDGQRVEGQRRDGQRQDGQRAEGQRHDGQRQDGQRAEGQRQDWPRQDGQQAEGQRRDGQRTDGQRTEGQSRDNQRRDGQRRDNQRPDGQRRDNQRPDGQRRDGQRPDGQRRDGQRPDGQRRDGQRPDGQRRDNQRPDGQRPDGQRRDNQRPDGQRRDNQRPDGQRPDGQRPDGQRTDGQRRDGQRPDGQRPEGQRFDGQRRDGQRFDGPRRDNQRPEGQRQDGRRDNQRSDWQRRDGQRPEGQRREGQRPDGPRPEGLRTDGPRSDGQRSDGPRRDGQRSDRPYGDRGNRPAGSGSGTGQGRFTPRPRSDGGTRPAQGGRPSYGGKPDSSGRPGSDRQGRPGGFNRAGDKPARPGRPVFGKKDDKKVAEPSKDDRKQDWKKNEQMRTVKSKDNKDTDKKENKIFLEKQDGRNKQRGQRGQRTNTAVKREMPKKVEPVITSITVPMEITVKELAEKLHKSCAEIIKVLMKKGVMASVNQVIDYDAAEYVGEAYNVIVEPYVEVDVFEEAFSETPESDDVKEVRPPVVVVMGHVDHGKTSLLDAIRDTSVTQSEAGGITQHIGAYTVAIGDKPITFLDTPGHEAFTAMRMRGAQVTDIAVLVVDANDGVMPQTVEAINHAKAAGVEIIVAINKIDKPGANPDRVKQELTEHGILVEDWGGDTIAVPVSALKKTGIEHLLEMIILVAEMKELRANPNKNARGSIVEAKLDKGRGPVATVLVQDGTLKVGDPIVAGYCFGKIRAMIDDKGRRVKKAGPSIPVEIIGLSEVPSAGDMFYVAENEKQARQLSETVIAKGRESMIKAPNKVSLNDLFQQIQAGSVKELNVVVKADVQGSVEALRTSLDKLTNDQVRIRTIHGGVGAVTESDVMLASASNAIIIGFNVRPEPVAKTVADAEKVDIRMYRVIYAAIEDISAAMKGMLDPVFQEKVLGHAEIRQLFKASGIGTIGGAYVTDGKIQRNAQVRIVRDGTVVYDGTLDTLRRFKDDVREVAAGYECGLLFNKFNDIKENDKVEAYAMEEIPR